MTTVKVDKLTGKTIGKNNMVRLSRKDMLEEIGIIYFEKTITREELRTLENIVKGNGDEETKIISKCKGYRLEINNKKRLKIYLYNLEDNVIYYYNVKIRFLWRMRVNNQVEDAIIFKACRAVLF